MINTMANPLIDKEQSYLRFDASFPVINGNQAEYVQQVLLETICQEWESKFVLRYRSSAPEGRTTKKTANNKLQQFLQDNTQDFWNLLFCGFLRTDLVKNQRDMDAVFHYQTQHGTCLPIIRKRDDYSVILQSPPVTVYPHVFEDEDQRIQYFEDIATFSQTDKRFYSNQTTWDVLCEYYLEKQKNNPQELHGNVEIVLSCHMLADTIEDEYNILKSVAQRIGKGVSLYCASISIGPTRPETYYVASFQYSFPKEKMNHLGFYNIFPESWSLQLSNPPVGIVKNIEDPHFCTVEAIAPLFQGQAIKLLNLRKYLKPILLPMNANAVYFGLCSFPHIIPIEKNEITLRKLDNGMYVPEYREMNS